MLEPTTGPRSIRTGAACCATALKKRGNTFEVVTMSDDDARGAGTGAGAGGSGFRSARLNRPVNPPSDLADRRGARGCADGDRRLRLGRFIGDRLLARLRRTLPLHVDAAAEMRAVGDRHPRGRDIAVDRSGIANIDFVRRGHIAVYFTLDD